MVRPQAPPTDRVTRSTSAASASIVRTPSAPESTASDPPIEAPPSAHFIKDIRLERNRFGFEDMSQSNVLADAMKINPLTGATDWSKWNRKLKGHLIVIGLWKILTGKALEPSMQDEALCSIWLDKQEN